MERMKKAIRDETEGRKRIDEQGTFLRRLANHSLSSTASQGTSNIPFRSNYRNNNLATHQTTAGMTIDYESLMNVSTIC